MATIYIENQPYEANPERNLLEVCLSLGFDLPYFCWHSAMGSVGACRQCAVKQFKNEQDTRGQIVMACMTPAAEGTRISIADEQAVNFRRGVIEGLMLSHPHDCPVCDEGGECHLQDMTELAGHSYRRYRFPKRTFRNQYLGPFVAHEMNRCIQCYRCVRFYRGYAGGRDLNAFSIHNTVFFGRDRDGVLESEFSGNLVEVCPTGVFVDRTLSLHYTRKWDQTFAPSLCPACGLGCNISPGERYGMLRRIVNRYHPEINGYFLCDRGRYSYEFVNSDARIRQPLAREGTAVLEVSGAEAIKRSANALRAGGGVIGIGSPRASVEANYALRLLVGPENFYAGVSGRELRLLKLILEVLRAGPAPAATLQDIDNSDAALVLGEDVMNFSPRMALSLMQSTRQEPRKAALKLRIPQWNDYAVREVIGCARGPLFIATPNATRLDEIATRVFRRAPDDIARLGFAVANAIDSAAPRPHDMPDDAAELAGVIAAALRKAERPIVVAGPGCGSEDVIRAAANVTRALARAGRGAKIAFTMPDANSIGLALMSGAALDEAVQAEAATVIVLENDITRRLPDTHAARLLGPERQVIALDFLRNGTVERASLALPAGTFAESDGTYINNETRAQRYFQVFVPPGDIQESWRWLRDAMLAAGRDDPGWIGLDDVIAAAARDIPALARITEAAPPANFRMDGARIPREPHRYSGRTAMLANITVHEPKPPEDLDSPLSFSMEGSPKLPPPPVIPFFWAPRWNSVRALNKFQSEAGRALPTGPPPGVRLIEPPPDGAAAYFDTPPPAFAPREGEFLIVPLYNIFASQELVHWAPAIASLAPAGYVAVNAEAGFSAGHVVDVRAAGASQRLPVVIAPELPSGVAGLLCGARDVKGFDLPSWGRIERVMP